MLKKDAWTKTTLLIASSWLIHYCLSHTNLLCLTLKCTFYLYLRQFYIFVPKQDLCVYSLMMATYGS